MIVDDNSFNIYSLSTMLEVEFGVKSDSAYHGENALEMVKARISSSKCKVCKGVYKLVFMDISMPIMDGY